MAATQARPNGPYDPDRDATTLPLIRKAIEHGVPLLAICRGIQELNVALGGTLAAEIQEREGSLDHRAPVSDNQDERFAIRQSVSIKPGSCLAGVFGAGDILVNSVHRQAIDRLGSRLQVEAVAEDGTVEAVSVKDARAFAVGVQWHPEYWVNSDGNSAKIFRAFGDAARAHALAQKQRENRCGVERRASFARLRLRPGEIRLLKNPSNELARSLPLNGSREFPQSGRQPCAKPLS